MTVSSSTSLQQVITLQICRLVQSRLMRFSVAVFGAYLAPPSMQFAAAYKYVEKIQMTGFTIQEFILSGIYVWKTLDILKGMNESRRTHRIMWQLFSINVVIVILDIGLLVVEYRNEHVLEQTFKSFIYSVKLKMEFAILSKLVSLTTIRDDSTAMTVGDTDDFLNTTRTVSNASKAPLYTTRPRFLPTHEEERSEKMQVIHLEQADLSQDPDVERVDGHTSTSADLEEYKQKVKRTSDDLYAEAIRSIAG